MIGLCTSRADIESVSMCPVAAHLSRLTPHYPQKFSNWALSWLYIVPEGQHPGYPAPLPEVFNLDITSEMKCCTADVRGACLHLKVLFAPCHRTRRAHASSCPYQDHTKRILRHAPFDAQDHATSRINFPDIIGHVATR